MTLDAANATTAAIVLSDVLQREFNVSMGAGSGSITAGDITVGR